MEHRSHLFYRIVGIVLAGAALLLPLLVVAEGLDPFRFPKVLILRTAAVLLLVAYGVRGVWSSCPDWRKLSRDRLSVILVGICAWCGVAAAFSSDPAVSWWGWTDVTAALILFASSRDYVRATGASWFFWLLLIPGVVNSGALMLQSAGVWHPIVTLEAFQTLPYHDQVLLSRAAFLGNRDDVGVYLLIPLSIGLSLMMAARERRARATAGIAVLWLLLGILVSTTLTAIALAVPMTAPFLLVRARSSRLWRRRLLVIAPLLLGLVIVAGAASDRARESDSIPERLTRYAEGLMEGQYMKATGARILPAMVSAHLVRENLLFGIGPGRFPLEFHETSQLLRERYPKLLFAPSIEWFDMAHNDFLESAAEAGMPVLILMIGAMAEFLRRTLLPLPKDDDKKMWMRFGAGVLLVAIALAALVLFPLQLAAVYGSLALVAGGAVGAAESR